MEEADFIVMHCMLPADAIIGVTLFGDNAPESLGTFSSALFALFRVAAGETSVALRVVHSVDGAAMIIYLF